MCIYGLQYKLQNLKVGILFIFMQPPKQLGDPLKLSFPPSGRYVWNTSDSRRPPIPPNPCSGNSKRKKNNKKNLKVVSVTHVGGFGGLFIIRINNIWLKKGGLRWGKKIFKAFGPLFLGRKNISTLSLSRDHYDLCEKRPQLAPHHYSSWQCIFRVGGYWH